MKDRFFEGVNPDEISFELNRNRIPSPRGGLWSNVAIYRLLKNEFHLGKIIYGKTQGSGHKNKKTRPLKKMPRNQWIVGIGEHTPIKTEEEHSKILAILESRKTVPVAARKGKRILSGILKCKLCGRGACFYDNKGVESVRTCKKLPMGDRCPNRGFKASFIYEALNKELDKYKNELLKYNPDKDGESKQLQNLIGIKIAQLKRLQSSTSKIQDMYEMGHLDKKEYMERWSRRNDEIQELEDDIAELKHSNKHLKQPSAKEMISKITRFQDIWDNEKFTNKEKNTLAKQIIKKIVYQRDEDDNLFIDIEFL